MSFINELRNGTEKIVRYCDEYEWDVIIGGIKESCRRNQSRYGVNYLKGYLTCYNDEGYSEYRVTHNVLQPFVRYTRKDIGKAVDAYNFLARYPLYRYHVSVSANFQEKLLDELRRMGFVNPTVRVESVEQEIGSLSRVFGIKNVEYQKNGQRVTVVYLELHW